MTDDDTMTRAWILYSVHRQSLAQCAQALYGETRHTTVLGFRMAIYRDFRKRGRVLRRRGPQKAGGA